MRPRLSPGHGEKEVDSRNADDTIILPLLCEASAWQHYSIAFGDKSKTLESFKVNRIAPQMPSSITAVQVCDASKADSSNVAG